MFECVMNKSTGTTTITIFISYYNKKTAERPLSEDNPFLTYQENNYGIYNR